MGCGHKIVLRGGHVLWEYMSYGRTCLMGGQVLLKDMSFKMNCRRECMSYGREGKINLMLRIYLNNIKMD